MLYGHLLDVRRADIKSAINKLSTIHRVCQKKTLMVLCISYGMVLFGFATGTATGCLFLNHCRQQVVCKRHDPLSRYGITRTYSSDAAKRKKEYAGRKLVGFTMEQMYDVVQDVENYKQFVPFCRKSDVKMRREDKLVGELEIGFHPVIESYVSHVTLIKPKLVKADCIDGKLFNHLTTTWHFAPGLRDHPRSCVINFYVSFEFKSLLHSQMAHFFFSELVRQMESAFFTEAKRRYGPPSIEMVKLNIKS